MIKITYTPPSYAKLLYWKLAKFIHPQKYILHSIYESLSLDFPSKETWAKKDKNTCSRENLLKHAEKTKKTRERKKERKEIAMFSK
jgi:hypothetical protein